tara:strand:- start:1979 stop:2578 length:600 start_codon:yes stop_codon:yes gene_type:complete
MKNYRNAIEMQNSAKKIAPTNNFTGIIDEFNKENATILSDLFDLETLDYYARKNCGFPVTKDEVEKYETEYRGGLQGDYSSDMDSKIKNIVDSLINYPASKRAVVMMNNKWWTHDDTDEAKCCRELHFYLSTSKDGNSMLLNCTGIFRAQAVDIMPKNFFFVYKILEVINEKLNSQAKQKYLIGSYTHFVTILVPTRYD